MNRFALDMLLALASVPVSFMGLPLLLQTLHEPALADAIGIAPLYLTFGAPIQVWLERIKLPPGHQVQYRTRLRDAALFGAGGALLFALHEAPWGLKGSWLLKVSAFGLCAAIHFLFMSAPLLWYRSSAEPQ